VVEAVRYRERKWEREARLREAGKSRKREGTNVSSVFPGARFLGGRRQDAVAPPMTVVSVDFARPRFAAGSFLRGATARKNPRGKRQRERGWYARATAIGPAWTLFFTFQEPLRGQWYAAAAAKGDPE